ncbi:OsmC family protein [Patiriisocius hiemis]|uniref:OsmC family protein n=1 Tax=Patiriisocius hiemis TaxID=3075604 RepID=A0ABU2YC90_9FLAO|nr:OsmC family protein [Constantimarinum sp. W242]MDT0555803.1 OsmC family protein [Constantimarinum sp. W242]
MKVTLARKNNDYQFEALGKTNTPVLIDNTSQDDAKGASPMELLLMGVGGCSAIDVIHILKKQRQVITDYKIEVEGARKQIKEAKPFESIHVTIFLEGDIVEAKALKAASLSFEKYCSVSITLEESVAVTYAVVLNGKKL